VGGVLLSHFYLLREYRGRGLGQLAMEFIERQVIAMGARRIELLVLRVNSAAVGLYRKNGYVVAEAVLTKLGNGAVLEDFLMRKEIEN
jgi:ribosomal protein S18 acetylase RimI-like enzyme